MEYGNYAGSLKMIKKNEVEQIEKKLDEWRRLIIADMQELKPKKAGEKYDIDKSNIHRWSSGKYIISYENVLKLIKKL